ncbi:MAG: di-heme enzyme [Pseudohongiella sp.]|nr:di-heme enzyme [Pseudohongiella sp.]
MKRLLILPVVLSAQVFVPAGIASEAEAYQWRLPDWVPVPRVPADNPMSDAKVLLGRHLFYDTRLSLDQSMSCSSCHEQEKAFTDGRATSPGINGLHGARSSMSLTNVAYLPALTWANPLMKSLETQALIPVFGSHPVEMGMEGQEALLVERLTADSRYKQMFIDAFPEQQGDISVATVVKAIASFERSLLSFNAPYYRYKYGGENTAISDAALRGESLFFGEKYECYHCHGGLNFTDNIVHARLPFEELGFHNTGLYNLDNNGAYPIANSGLFEVTDDPADEGKFRTPTLLNIALTAPYMHDGSIATLEQVLTEHYAHQGRAVFQGQQPNPRRSSFIVGYQFTAEEIADMLAFLDTLTDDQFVKDPAHSNPFE